MKAILALLGREISNDFICVVIEANAAPNSDPFAALVYYREAARRGHGWTLNTEEATFSNDVASSGPVAAMDRAFARRVEAEPEWPGMRPPTAESTGRLWSRSRGSAWLVTREGRLVTILTRPGRDYEHEIPVVMQRAGKFAAAVVDAGGERWLLRDGTAKPAPHARVGAVIGNPRHELPDGADVIVEGARRARAARR